MSVLTSEQVALLNKFADSQPALNEPGKPLGESQVKLGDAMSLAAGGSAKKFTWDFAAQGGTGTKVLGTIPAGSIVTGVVLDATAAAVVGATDAAIELDGTELLTQDLDAQGAAIDMPATTPAKATQGEVTLVFTAAATAGKLDVIVQFIGA